MILTKKYRSFARDGFYSDPLIDYMQSTTYHFDDNATESDTEELMLIEIEKPVYKFKENSLSIDSVSKINADKLENTTK